MKIMAFILALFALWTPASTLAYAHHAELCKVQAGKQAKGEKRVRVAKNCIATRAHDRETAKR
jgi:hypothetical protein